MGRCSGKKRLTPDDPQWFKLFLCSRWGKSLAEIDELPVNEFYQHWHFWTEFRWGMNDDLQAMALAHHMKVSAPKSTVKPWMLKQWTTQRDYTFRLSHLVQKPVSAIRSGFFAILNAAKELKNGKRKHQ